jgi:hypothetical protein
MSFSFRFSAAVLWGLSASGCKEDVSALLGSYIEVFAGKVECYRPKIPRAKEASTAAEISQ